MLASVGEGVMSKLPQDALLIETKERMQLALSAVMTKFDMHGKRDGSVAPVDARPRKSGVGGGTSSGSGASGGYGVSGAGGSVDFVCFACGKPGHTSTKCTSAVKLSVEEQEKLREAFFRKRKKAAVKAISVVTGRKLNADVVVDGAKAVALVDTGATISLIRPDVLPMRARPKRACDVSAKFANGDSVVLREQVLVHIEVDGVEYDHWMYVYPSAHQVLLGMDFLDGRANID
jgi:predicted aspartyl protease